MRIILFLLGLQLLLSLPELSAANFYWVGSGNWSTGSNWSATSGGTPGSTAPSTTGDIAIFDGNGTNNCTMDVTINIDGIQMNSGYTGTVTQGASSGITIGASGWTISAGTFTASSASISVSGGLTIGGGTFSGSSGTITLTGALTINSGTFTSTSGTLTTNSNITYNGGTFNDNSGTVSATATLTISGNIGFYNLHLNPSATATYTISNTISTRGLYKLEGSNPITVNTGTIDANGNITITNTQTGGGGSALLNIAGTGSQLLTGSGTSGTGLLCSVQINKSSGTLTLASIVSCAGSWTYVTGTVDATTNSSSVELYGNVTLDGQGASSTMTFHNTRIGSGTVTLGGNLDVNNNLGLASGSTFTAASTSHTINIGGNWANQGGTWTNGTGTVTFDGGAVYKTIRKVGSTETFYNLAINRTGGTAALLGGVSVTNSLTLTAGKIKTGTQSFTVAHGATSTAGSNSTYVYGPMRKTGNAAFTFPVGDSAAVATPYHPLSISAPSATTDEFQAEYKASVQTAGSTLGTGIASVSACDHWILTRRTGSSNVTPTLNWNANCSYTAYTEMTPAVWDGTQWADLGQASVSISAHPAGTLAASNPATFSTNPLVIAYKTVNKSYATARKTLDGGYYDTDGAVLYFRFDEEYKDTDGDLNYKVYKLSTDAQITMLVNTANDAPSAYGHNKYKIDLYDSANTIFGSGMYLLEITNEKNEKWYLRFNKT